jgi:acylphosphatase
MKRIAIKVSGKVQGVFFRASTKEIANEMGITGFVRNEQDGSVYIEAEGNEEELEKFVAWCHQGPSHAAVKSVQVEEISLQGFAKFEVRR